MASGSIRAAEGLNVDRLRADLQELHYPQGSKYLIIIYSPKSHNYYPKTEYRIIGPFGPLGYAVQSRFPDRPSRDQKESCMVSNRLRCFPTY